MKKYIALLLILLPSVLYAADLYVTPSGAGSASGSDWSNALPWTFTPARGNTYYIAGGSYTGGKTLSTPVSGSILITLRKATTGNSGGVSGWNESFNNQGVFTGTQINFTTSHWTIDGVTGSGKSGYGFKFIGNNGSNGAVIYSNNSGTKTGLIVKYSEISSSGTITHECVPLGTCTRSGVYYFYADQSFIVHNYIHDVAVPILIRDTGTLTISHNRIESNDSGTSHAEAFSTNAATKLNIYNNDFVNIMGTAVLAFFNGGTISGADIYNNLFRYTNEHLSFQNGWSNGVITCTNAGTYCNNFNIYSNTIINPGPSHSGSINVGTGGTAANWNIKNNLWWCDQHDCGTVVNTKQSNFYYDKNWYGNVTYNTAENGAINGGSENPFTNSAVYNYTVKDGSTPIGAGVTLGGIYTYDISGTARSVPYDIGAYDFLNSPPTPLAPNPLAPSIINIK